MRVLIFSNDPRQCGSAYALQTAQLAPRLRSLGHEVAIGAFSGLFTARTQWDGIPVLPPGIKQYGGDVFAGHAAEFGADVVLTLMDLWALGAEDIRRCPVPVAAWLPVDCSPLSVMDLAALQGGGVTPIAMSQFGAGELSKAGFPPLGVVPHGIDTGVFCPQDKAAAREAWGVPAGAFVVGMNATNLDAVRKGFAEQFAAFAIFRARHPEAGAVLMVHTLADRRGQGGLDLATMAQRIGIHSAVRFPDAHRYITGDYTDADMAQWYACLDVYSGCAWGEGFGIPLIEAQACGLPVVATEFSAMKENTGCGWRVPGDYFWNPRHCAWWAKPRIGQIAEAYERAYGGEGDPVACREFALPFSADRVLAEHWQPVLEALEERITRPARERATAGPAVSVCFASRGRPSSLLRAVTGLLALADDPAAVEVIVAADPDDGATHEALGLVPQARVWVAPERFGYNRLHDYLNPLAKQAQGEWLMWFNDDMIMKTQGWDTIVRGADPAVLWPGANHVQHANIAPIWPRAWAEALGHASPTSHMDTYLQRLGEALGKHVRIPVEIVHDRFDVTGHHHDATYAEGRELLGPEGMVPGHDEAAVAEQVDRDAQVIRDLPG